MFKFKMSLLFNNLKFRVAMVVLVVAAIAAGIIFIPKNKAGNIKTSLTSNDIIAQACKMTGKSYWTNPNSLDGFENGWGHGVTNGYLWGGNSGDKKYGVDFKLADNNSFSSLDCTGLIYYTLTSLGCTTNGFSFQNPVPVDTTHWYNYTNPTITYKGTTANVSVLKSGVPIESMPYYKCQNGSEIPSGSIVVSAGSKLGNGYSDHAWIYLGNFGTVSEKEVAKKLIKDMGVNPSLLITGDINGEFSIRTYINGLGKTVPVIQKTDATSTYWRIESTADTAGYGVYINNGNPTSSVTVTDPNSGKVKAIGPIYAFQIANETKKEITGNYKIQIRKVKADGTTVITSSEATFKINGKEQNTSKGILNIAQGKKIGSEGQIDSFEIVETKAPAGYNLLQGTVKLQVKFKKSGDKYIIDRDQTTSSGLPKGAKIDISSDNTTITIYIPNEEQPGKYNIELHKVNEKNELIKTTAKFNINGSEKETNNGILTIASGVEVKDANKVDTYTIKETQAPQNYKMFDGTINLKVKMTKTENGFVLKQEGVTLDTDKQNLGASFKIEGSTIKVYVQNKKIPFDLSLRKYISKINGKDVEPSREPVINEQSIKMLQTTGTASYYHTKDSIGVRVGDEIEYTLRVYNEGEILGFAKQITDYLPEGLSFVKLSDDNSKEYTTDSKPGSKEVVIKYSGNKTIKSLRDFIGKEVKVTDEYYQEVKMICKVENTEKVYITNRGEITNYGYSEKDENGNTVWKEATEIGNVDRDSVQNTIKDELNLDTWYESAKENTYTDENGKTVVDKNYYPGSQDDDDFETVELLTGKYNIIIRKVDSSDEKTTLQGAYFSVKGTNIEKETEVGPTSTNGEVTVVKGVKIKNEDQVDEYSIKETKAPNEYKLYDGEVKVKVETKFDGNSFVIDEKNTKVDGKNVKFSINEDNTTITIIVPNARKEFDLSLRKFITEINGKELEESREPQVDVSKLVSEESTTATYNHSKNPIDVNTTDIVTYTIRVYNEGEIDGYASKIMDDIPEGLVFVPGEYDKEGKPTNINAEYGWTVYREMKSGEVAIPENMIEYNGKSYVVTDNVEEADVIVTDHLSKENGTDNLLKAFDSKTMKQLDYKDVKVSFKVIEPTTSDRIIINYAQVTDDTDSTGKPVTDRDSTPNEWNDGEDDQDIEKIKVRYFDLSLLKWVTKAIVYENGVATVTETNHTPYDNPEPIVKVDLKNTNIDNVEVKFEYSIRITNEGEIAGYAKEISDYIPQGLKFVASDNPQWTEKDGKIVTRALENTLLQPGEHADVTVILTWINGADNLGVKTNIAEISEDYNDYGTPDIDSTPNNQVPGEDDIDDAPVMLSIRTGKPIVYTGVAIAVLVILSVGVVVIRKRVLR